MDYRRVQGFLNSFFNASLTLPFLAFSSWSSSSFFFASTIATFSFTIAVILRQLLLGLGLLRVVDLLELLPLLAR